MPPKLSDEEVAARFAENGVVPLSPYLGASQSIQVKCMACEHVWSTSGQTPFRSGCPLCALRRKSEARGYQSLVSQDVIEVRLQEKGWTLRGTYNGIWKPLRAACLRCGTEKTWTLASNALNTPYHCKVCQHQSTRLPEGEIQARLAHIGAVLLGERPRSTHNRVDLRCVTCGHLWSPFFSAVTQGYGCPRCNRSNGWKAETETRQLLQKLTGWDFPKARPQWLKGRRRTPLELDGYNEEHAIAFEYQGEQHYQPLFGKVALTRAKINDERKRQLCRYHGVYLIRVPFWVLPKLRDFLQKKLRKGGYSESI